MPLPTTSTTCGRLHLFPFSYYNVWCAYRADKLVTGQKLYADVIIISKTLLATDHILGVNIALKSILGNKVVQFLGASGPIGIFSRLGTGSALTINPMQNWRKNLSRKKKLAVKYVDQDGISQPSRQHQAHRDGQNLNGLHARHRE